MKVQLLTNSCSSNFIKSGKSFGVLTSYMSFADFLLIVLKDLLPRRRDLRLILMSATLNAELFSTYYGGAPTIHIPVKTCVYGCH